MMDQELKWDAFRSKPRSRRTNYNPEAAYMQYLQWIKVGVLSRVSLLCFDRLMDLSI